MVFGMLPILPTYGSEHIPQAVINSATNIFPGFTAETVTPSPIAGMYRISFGSKIVYMSADGRYVLRGDIIDIKQGINLTEVERNKVLVDEIEVLGEDSMIVFAPEEVKGTITVFTDITCPYCAKLHKEVPQLIENGIKVRYLAFPRAGIPSSVADDMVSVWCADDPQQALTDAKAGFTVAEERCPNPVKAHYDMGQQIGIGGTPTIILEDGSMIGGYVPYLKLVESAQQAHATVVQ